MNNLNNGMSWGVYHYLAPSEYVHVDDRMLSALDGAFAKLQVPVHRGATSTTDVPFREIPRAIEYVRSKVIVAVEMEAAGLYTLARARQRPIVCFAHVTNRMGRVVGDFEKGAAGGGRDALQAIAAATAGMAGSPRGVTAMNIQNVTRRP